MSGMARPLQSSSLRGSLKSAVPGSSQGVQHTQRAARRARGLRRARERSPNLRAAVCEEAPTHRTVTELRAGQEQLAALVAQLEAVAPGGGGAVGVEDVAAGLDQVRARLERVAEELRCCGKPCDESSSSSSSSEDECMDEAAAARMEAKRAMKEAKMAEKAAKKAAKEREKAAKQQAKAARRAQEVLTAAGAAMPLCEQPAAAIVASSSTAIALPVAPAEAPASGALVLRTMRGNLVLDGAGASGSQPASAVQVEVCQGKACVKRGASAVMAGLSEALAGDAGVTVAGCKCMDQCKKGPNLRVRVVGEPPVIATGVPASDAACAVSRMF